MLFTYSIVCAVRGFSDGSQIIVKRKRGARDDPARARHDDRADEYSGLVMYFCFRFCRRRFLDFAQNDTVYITSFLLPEHSGEISHGKDILSVYASKSFLPARRKACAYKYSRCTVPLRPCSLPRDFSAALSFRGYRGESKFTGGTRESRHTAVTDN